MPIYSKLSTFLNICGCTDENVNTVIFACNFTPDDCRAQANVKEFCILPAVPVSDARKYVVIIDHAYMQVAVVHMS